MKRQIFVFFLMLAIIAALFPVKASAEGHKVEFTVSMENPWNHYYYVTMDLARTPDNGYVDLIMPVWIPGSYKLREYPHFVEQEAAHDLNGATLEFEKIAKNRWRVYTNDSKTLRFTYRIFAFEKGIRHSYLTDSRAIINGVHMFMFPEPYKNDAVKITIKPYEKFNQIATGLRKDPGNKFILYADNFDQIFDSPMDIGTQEILEFRVQDVPHYISISGSDDYDADLMVKHTKAIVKETIKVIGEIPYTDYTFLMVMGMGGGGIEHSNSTFLGLRGSGYSTDRGIRGLMGLVAHEFFHTWNVKRIRPFALGPFDYSRENYTRSLWVAEGITSYYDPLIRLRAGYMSQDEYLKTLGRDIGGFLFNPARKIESAEESSFDAWIKQYINNENSRNTHISYYGHGALIGSQIDLMIINATNGEKSLDDVMRHLYFEYYKKQGRGFKPEEMQSTCELVAGISFDDFFDRYVRGREDMNFAENLALAGFELKSKSHLDISYLGATLMRDGTPTISFIKEASPAYVQGLSIDDKILSVNGTEINTSLEFYSIVNKKKPGDKLNIRFEREGKERTISIALSGDPSLTYTISRTKNPTAKQDRVYNKWLSIKE